MTLGVEFEGLKTGETHFFIEAIHSGFKLVSFVPIFKGRHELTFQVSPSTVAYAIAMGLADTRST